MHFLKFEIAKVPKFSIAGVLKRKFLNSLKSWKIYITLRYHTSLKFQDPKIHPKPSISKRFQGLSKTLLLSPFPKNREFQKLSKGLFGIRMGFRQIRKSTRQFCRIRDKIATAAILKCESSKDARTRRIRASRSHQELRMAHFVERLLTIVSFFPRKKYRRFYDN